MSRFARVRAWIDRLPTAVPAAIAVVGLALLITAAFFLYRTFQFVEHDNEFCLSCHLMEEPYERFGQSAHRGLGCKACHQPTLVARSRMALSQILENPDTLATHAEVPNSACASCHVEGDPEQWLLISRSAGHRMHLESDDPALQGLMCVECHSSSVHEFAATPRTCGQAGCHDQEDTEIRLGTMGRLTIHCVACHDYSRPVPDTLARSQLAAVALRPAREQCLSCHQMRERVAGIPADEPHDAVCGACHNPHDQPTPQAAVGTCGEAGCHTAADTLTPMHRGLAEGVLENCSGCHTAHDFRIGEVGCVSCHQETRRDASGAAPFDHAQHLAVDCAACHTSERTHGAVTLTGVRDCRACHHTAQAASDCADCHRAADYGTRGYSVLRTVHLSVADRDPARALPFDHRRHTEVACATCHSEGLELSAAAVECASCHEQHHQPTSPCIACHEKPPATAHTVEAHVAGCAGSGCHDPVPEGVRRVPRTRNMCLGCHQEQRSHMVGGNCADCHRLPPVRGGVE